VTAPAAPSVPRLPFVDALKAIASQVIVLHHLALYGSLSDPVQRWAPALFDAVHEHGRLAVQVFLVVAGFLSAGALAPGGRPALEDPLALLGRRYMRLAPAYLAAIGLVLAAAAIARPLATLDHTPATPSAAQLVSNLLMLQDIVGVEALSAGLWYVAIDLQLYALLIALLWVAQRAGGAAAAPVLVAAMTLASLLHFNREPAWDVWAPYFFGAYGLGVLAAWAARAPHTRLAIGAVAAIGVLGLAVEPRVRVALALATALSLAWAAQGGAFGRWPASRALGWLGRIAYSVFLVHYPVLLVFDALAVHFAPQDPWANLAGLLLAWATSIAAGALLHRQVELRFAPASPRRAAPPGTPAPADDAPAGRAG
jgi:peptidoglycan/LPS O-acetylase OafA/YrhL